MDIFARSASVQPVCAGKRSKYLLCSTSTSYVTLTTNGLSAVAVISLTVTGQRPENPFSPYVTAIDPPGASTTPDEAKVCPLKSTGPAMVNAPVNSWPALNFSSPPPVLVSAPAPFSVSATATLCSLAIVRPPAAISKGDEPLGMSLRLANLMNSVCSPLDLIVAPSNTTVVSSRSSQTFRLRTVTTLSLPK